MDLTPLTLRGRFLTLEPIEERHAPDLFAVMQDEEVCRYLAWPPPTTLVSTIKARQAGFQDCMDTEDMFRKWFLRFRELRWLP